MGRSTAPGDDAVTPSGARGWLEVPSRWQVRGPNLPVVPRGSDPLTARVVPAARGVRACPQQLLAQTTLALPPFRTAATNDAKLGLRLSTTDGSTARASRSAHSAV